MCVCANICVCMREGGGYVRAFRNASIIAIERGVGVGVC